MHTFLKLKTRPRFQETWLLTSKNDDLDAVEERREGTAPALRIRDTVGETCKFRAILGSPDSQGNH